MSQEGCQGLSRPSGRNRGLPLRRRGALLQEIFLTQGLNLGLLQTNSEQHEQYANGKVLWEYHKDYDNLQAVINICTSSQPLTWATNMGGLWSRKAVIWDFFLSGLIQDPLSLAFQAGEH